jgi:hypothetical protein
MRTEVDDRIFAQYGLRSVDLRRAVAHFNLDDDPDIENIRTSKSQVINEINKEVDSVIDEEFKQRFEAAANALPKFEVGPDGLLGYDDALLIQFLITDFHIETTQKQVEHHKAERRAFLKAHQEQKY